MKVIDLLNKMANGKEVPNKIQYDYKIFYYDGSKYVYDNDVFNEYNRLEEFIFFSTDLNKEINFPEEDKEIEEKSKEFYELCKTMYEEDREIEKLGETYINFNGCIRAFKDLNDYGGKILANKIDEIIDILNELKKGK